MKRETVHLYVLDTMADWEAAYAVAGINNPQFQAEPGRFTVRTVAPTAAPVRTAGGVAITPDMTLAELRPQDSTMLILPGGAAWDAGVHLDAVEKAREFLSARVPVAAVCGATGALAAGGVLDERPHTSNAREYLAYVPNYAGQAHYVNEPTVVDGDLITASGTAPVDFARAIFELLGVYLPEVLEAWVAMYKHQDQSAFYTLMAASATGTGAA